MELETSELSLVFCRVGRRQRFPGQYACTCPPASVPPPHSLSCISTAVLIRRFNHNPRLFCCPNRPASLSHICSYLLRILPLLSPASLLASRHHLFFSRHLLTNDRANISICWGGDATTRLRNTFFVDLSLCQLYFAYLRGKRQPMSHLVQSRVRSSGVGYHLQPTIFITVRSASYHPARPTPSPLRHPIISASLCRLLPPLVALHLHCISTCRHRLHCHRISASHRPSCCCCPINRVCFYMSSATTPILVEPLSFSLIPCYLSSCTACHR